MTQADDHMTDRVAALEAEVARLRAASARPPATVTAPPGSVSRRQLLLAAGVAAAAGGLASPEGADAQSASTVAFTPVDGISATDVQAAIEELERDKQPLAMLDVRAAGAVGDGRADDTAAVNRAIAEVEGAGGGTVLLSPGTFLFSGRITVPPAVDLWGSGGHQQGGSWTGTTLKASAAAAKIVFQGVGGQSGNFGVDGDRIANPVGSGPTGLVFLDTTIVRQFTALRVSRSASDGVVIRGSQNCLFTQCMLSDCTRHGLVLDSDALSSAFVRCDISNCGGDNLLIRSTVAGSQPPNYNTFFRCAFERGLWVDGGWTGPSHAQVNVTGAGDMNTFVCSGFTLPVGNVSSSRSLVLLAAGRTIFDSCDWVTTRAGMRAVRVTPPGTATFVGRNVFNTPIGIEWNRDASGGEPSADNVAGQLVFSAGTVPWTGTARPHETASFLVGRPHEIVLDPADYLDPVDGLRKGSSFGLRVRRKNEPGIRYQVSNTGEIQVSDGTTWTPKARWRLDPAGGWTTPDSVRFDRGIHVNKGVVALQETGNPAPTTLPDRTRAAVYVRSDKLVVAFNDGGTVRYRWLPLTGTATTWTHSTSPP